jgi:cytochrome P450
LESIGLEPLYRNTPITGTPIFLSKPLDPESLPTQTEPWLGHKYARFPKEAVLDLVIGVYDGTKGVLKRSPLCPQAIDPHFETLPGPALWSASDGPAWTAQRRVLFTADGRKILQDTNTSMADFVRAWKTPGWIPDTIPEGRP